MSSHHKRISILVLFILADLVLLFLLLRQNFAASVSAQQMIQKLAFLEQTPLAVLISDLTVPTERPPEVTLTDTGVFEVFTVERRDRKLSPLERSAELDTIAQTLLTAIAKADFKLSEVDSTALIKQQLSNSDATAGVLYFDTMIGPRTTDAAFEYWKTSTDHQETMSAPGLSKVGIATASATVEGELAGAVVSVFLKPQTMTAVPAVSARAARQQTFPEVSNQSVVTALNEYRKAHGIHPLSEHPQLCAYAEKRVQDLVKKGGLDNHDGFRADFADPENLPSMIKDYPGATIGENLAYQNCINMKTNQSFMAETATALIEWCFDSSTKGHREAQLNPAYNNVCARHQDGYFVILFGE